MAYRIEHQVTIAAPIDVVWRLVQDPALRTRWDARVCGARLLEPATPIARGSAFEVTMRMGLPMRFQMEYLTWKPPFKSSVRSTSRDLFRSSTTGSWQFSSDPVSGHTTWTTIIVFSAALPGLGRFVEQRFGRFFDHLTQLSQQQFKAFAEAQWQAEQVSAA